jgi:hypothetical protein
MNKFNEQNAFSFKVVLRYLWYAVALLGICWVLGLWRWHPKTYGCFGGWANKFERVQLLDVSSLQLYAWTIKRDCILGKSDRYDPKVYRSTTP